MERLEEEFGFEQISAGTLYRTLRQTEKEGLCKSEWETSESGPARRMYSITEAGEEYLCEHNPCRTIGIMPMIGLPLLRSLFTITVTITRWVFLGSTGVKRSTGKLKTPVKGLVGSCRTRSARNASAFFGTQQSIYVALVGGNSCKQRQDSPLSRGGGSGLAGPVAITV
jgi:hypothetical protein